MVSGTETEFHVRAEAGDTNEKPKIINNFLPEHLLFISKKLINDEFTCIGCVRRYYT